MGPKSESRGQRESLLTWGSCKSARGSAIFLLGVRLFRLKALEQQRTACSLQGRRWWALHKKPPCKSSSCAATISARELRRWPRTLARAR